MRSPSATGIAAIQGAGADSTPGPRTNRLLQNLGDDGVLGRRQRFGETLDEARAAILQLTAAALKEEAEVASREGTLIGRYLHFG